MKALRKFARKASFRLARREVKRQAQRSPKEAFAAAWRNLLSRPIYRLFIRIGQDPAKEGTQLKGRTFELLAAQIGDFNQATRIEISGGLKEALEGVDPLLVVHIHDGHRFFSRTVVQHGRDLARIVSNPAKHLRFLKRLGIDTSRIHLIKDDVLSLVHLRNAVREKQVLCCAIDYPDARGRSVYINPAIFGFANRSKIPVYFAKAHVAKDGSAKLISAGPYVNVDPIICAKRFLDFFNSVGESRVKMRIKRYNEHEDWPIYQRQKARKPENLLASRD